MKVHPFPTSRQKSLRRLPHIFTKTLELPFYSNTNVAVSETSDSFTFVVDTVSGSGEVSARMIEIVPGVTKVVVGDECEERDVWRFQLPAATVPEMATARLSGGELVVVVPKV